MGANERRNGAIFADIPCHGEEKRSVSLNKLYVVFNVDIPPPGGR